MKLLIKYVQTTAWHKPNKQ